jgi:DNA-binding HxlR family transcriptional regulator
MALTLEIIGERWTLLIVRDLAYRPRRFQDLVQSLRGVTPGLLSQRLKLLEQHGIVTSRLYSDHPPRAEYSLTPKGEELRLIIRAITIWGSKHLKTERVLVHRACDHPIEMAYHCADCDEVLSLEEIEYHTEATSKRGRSTRNSRRTPGESARTGH